MHPDVKKISGKSGNEWTFRGALEDRSPRAISAGLVVEIERHRVRASVSAWARAY